jgi:hypothetical protein
MLFIKLFSLAKSSCPIRVSNGLNKMAAITIQKPDEIDGSFNGY